MMYEFTESYTFPLIISDVIGKPYELNIAGVNCWIATLELRGPDNIPQRYGVPYLTQEAAAWQEIGQPLWRN